MLKTKISENGKKIQYYISENSNIYKTGDILQDLNNSVDDSSDEEFVCNIFILGMTIEWLQPQVDSLNYSIMMLGGKEEKMLSNPYKTLQTRLENVKKELNNTIRDYGYMYNSYINSES